MKRVAHAFVTTQESPTTADTLKPFYETLKIFYQRFNPDRELGYVALEDSTSKIILNDDADTILSMYADGHDDIITDYDYVVLHWIGSTFKGQTDIVVKYHEFLNKQTDNFLLMGHIIDGKEHGKGRSWTSGDYYFMFPITLIVNLKIYKELGKPSLGIGKTKQHLWIGNRTEENVHDHYTPLRLDPSDGTEEVQTKSIGWNIISESLKNGYPVLNLPEDLRYEKTFTYPDDGPEKFMSAIDSVWNMKVPNNVNQKKWVLESLQRKFGMMSNHIREAEQQHAVFLFNTEYAIFYKDLYDNLITDDLTYFIGPASGFKDFVLCFKHFAEQKNKIKFYHFDQSEFTLKLKKHMLGWDGDRNTFFDHVKSFRHYKKIENMLWPDITNWSKYLDELFAHFPSAEEFKNRWKLYTTEEQDADGNGGCKHIFLDLNIIDDPDSLFNLLPSNPKAKGIIWLSDIFLGSNEMVFGRKNLKNKLSSLVDKIHERNPATLIDYKDTNDTPIFNRADEIFIRNTITKNRSFCVLPFMHMQYKPNGQPKPCCRFDLDADEYNQMYELGDFWGANTIFLRDLVSQNSGAVTQDKYPGIHPEALAKMSDIGNASMEEAFDSRFWNDVRKKMLAGTTIPGCNKCYKEEDERLATKNVKPDLGFGFSMRAGMNYDWNNGVFDRLDGKKQIEFIELGFGNYCNLACRMCSSNLSTTWHDDDKALNGKYGRTLTPRIEDADIKISDETLLGLKEIKFTGGEPMVHPNFGKLINRIVKLDCAKNIKLEIFTNCSYSPSNKITKDLTQFKQVNLSLSIDGYGEVNDYIRYPSKWNKVDAAAKKWLEVESQQDHFVVQMNPTITIYNIMYLDDLYNWWYRIKLEANNSPDQIMYAADTNNHEQLKERTGTKRILVMNTANWPDYLDILLLPVDVKEKLIEKYANDDAKEIWKNWTDNIPTDAKLPLDLRQSLNRVNLQLQRKTVTNSSLKVFYEYTKDLDKLRKQDFKKSLPELYEAIKDLI